MISIIIPALNEAAALPATLDALFAQNGDFEVILVDGGSGDSTVAVAQGCPQVHTIQAPAGRATQMNAGAQEARGSMLLFLHADTVLPSGAVAGLEELSTRLDDAWGGFHHSFSGNTWALRAISWLHNWRCGLTRVFYGDQAIFVSSDLFQRVGGYPAEPILEDIMLSERLLETAKPVFLEETVVTDSRKFEQMGTVRSLLRCLLIMASYELRLPILGQRFFSPIR